MCNYVTPSLIGRAHTQNDPCCPSASEETLRRLRVHEKPQENTAQHNVLHKCILRDVFCPKDTRWVGCLWWNPMASPYKKPAMRFLLFSSNSMTINLANTVYWPVSLDQFHPKLNIHSNKELLQAVLFCAILNLLCHYRQITLYLYFMIICMLYHVLWREPHK